MEEEITAKVKCPIHGRHFKRPIFHTYVPQWRCETELIRKQCLSDNYHKAWAASFGRYSCGTELHEGFSTKHDDNYQSKARMDRQ
jgi:hypothetical protein